MTERRPLYPEHIPCPYCSRTIDLDYYELDEPEQPSRSRHARPAKPGPVRQARIDAVVQFLRNLKSPYYIQTTELAGWIQGSLVVSRAVALAVCKDLRKHATKSVGFTTPASARTRVFWALKNTSRIKPWIRQ